MPANPDETEITWNNYRIPKAKEPNTSEAPAMSWKSGKGRFGNQKNATPLADSYYNYPYDPNSAGAYYHHQRPGFKQGNQLGFKLTAGRPVMGGNVHQKVLDALQHRERPKTFTKNVYNNNQGPQPGQGFGNHNQNNWGNKGNFQPRFQNQNNGSFSKFNNFNQNRFQNQNKDYGFNRFNNQHNGDFNNHWEGDFNFNRQKFNKGPHANFDESFHNNSGYSNNRYEQGRKFPKKKPPPIEIPVHEIVPDLQDDSLPKDLKLLFQPLFCKLCSAQLSSNLTAKMHYKSKNHEKKIRKWLIDYAEKSGEPLHPRAQVTAEKKPEESESDPKWFYCEVCDLQLTGKLHAESHYMGRNHQRAVLGHKAPAGQGYYDKSGKWVRMKTSKSGSMNFEGGEDNFGNTFKRSSTEESAGPPAKKKKEAQPAQQFHCDVCNINTTCNEQLQNHYNGQKHAKKLLNRASNTDQANVLGTSQIDVVTLPQNQVEAVPIAVPTVADLSGDLSVYRTPSGSYYCPTCNLTTNSEQQFRQHLTSKNHAKKALQANINDK